MQEAELTGDVPPEGQAQTREDRKKENLRKRIASMTLKKKSKISQVGRTVVVWCIRWSYLVARCMCCSLGVYTIALRCRTLHGTCGQSV